MISLDKDKNKMTLEFIKDDKFNDNLLQEMNTEFAKLDRFKKVLVECIGMVPVEVGMYILEVSNHCDMDLITTDIKLEEFLMFSKPFQTNSSLKITIKKEK